ncbi:hypothetical protein ATANTOWER_017895 [Ataeniobius toweri]|uniref:Uncharacterized protein n=1 Tax=Ataeniobius toweri TaxID=208326 RepID=A0ABU7C352_9TELE|nr:hypothetical protein [Ataeniobius toweri]
MTGNWWGREVRRHDAGGEEGGVGGGEAMNTDEKSGGRRRRRRRRREFVQSFLPLSLSPHVGHLRVGGDDFSEMIGAEEEEKDRWGGIQPVGVEEGAE